MRTVSAYQMKDRWLICPERRTTVGLSVACEPFICLPLEAEADALGNALIAVLEHSEGNAQHPTDWKQYALPRLAAAGVKSERAFQLQSLLVAVTKSPEGVCFYPTLNGGASGSDKGFKTLTDQCICVPFDESAVMLGNALNQTVRKCLVRA